MAVYEGFAVSAAGANADDVRKAMAGLVVRNADGSPRVGVFSNGTGVFVSGKAAMAVDVAAFNVATLRSAGDGVVLFGNDGVVSLPIGAAPASNSRIDAVYVKHNDASKGDALSTPILAVAAGVASATPTPATVPAGALRIANITIPAGATTTQSSGVVVTQVAPMTAAAGGVVALRNQTEQDAFAAVAGQQAYRVDTKALVAFDGTSWGATGGQLMTAWGNNFGNSIGGEPLNYRIANGRVWVRGQVTNKGARNYAAGTFVAFVTLPNEVRPASGTMAVIGTSHPGTTGNVWLNVTTTDMRIATPVAVNSTADQYRFDIAVDWPVP